MPLIEKIQSPIQHYAWGGTSFIRDLLAIECNEPAAELWMGTHERGCSTLASAPNTTLADFVRTQRPCDGEGLPFLFKVLDANNMLSIQLHPNESAAKAGFERENASSIALDAPNRNYRDAFAKPELHCALTPFWMLWGIRPSEELRAVLQTELYAGILRIPFTQGNTDEEENANIQAMLASVLELSQETLNAGVTWLKDQWELDPPVDDKTHDYWMRVALEQHCEHGIDAGVFVIPLLNLVKLKPGQGSYQPAGVVHAYLRGTTMELMENSDNVLRAGLTPKHVDVTELLRNIDCSERYPRVLDGIEFGDNAKVYETEESTLRLSSECLNGTMKWKASMCTIGIVMEGSLHIQQGEASYEYKKGEQFFAPKGARAKFTGQACSFFTATTTGN